MRSRGLLTAVVLALAACAGGEELWRPPTPETPPDPQGLDAGASTLDASPPDAASADAADASPANDPNDLGTILSATCSTPIPSAGARASALPVYIGTCPALAAAPTFTTIKSSGVDRSFLVVTPTTIAPGETLPVVFMWHWLGGKAESMAAALDAQVAANARRFIGVVPSAKGDLPFRWPFEASQSQDRVDEEARFFDDMLACIGTALPVNKECVSSVGVSAGALWTSQLAVVRSERLSSIVSLSGGVGGIVRGWQTTPHRLPALVLWGGPTDYYPTDIPIMNFEAASTKLVSALSADHHFMVECTHNCGHVVPPFDAPDAGGGLLFDPIWRFVLGHPYWMPMSRSPFEGKPLPSAYPGWCGQGPSSPTPRATACP